MNIENFQANFLAGRLALERRFSFSDRMLFTHAPGPASSSGWSFSFQAGCSSHKNVSSRRRRSSARAVSTRKALRPPPGPDELIDLFDQVFR